MSLVLASRKAALLPPWLRNELWARARAVPSLDLRFAENKSLVNATTGAQLVTFTRASSGTYVDSQGTIRTAASGEPRFDHNPTTGASLGLLVEEQRQNLLVRSEGFNDASWSKNNASITADSIAAPNGTASADSLIENSASSEHFASQSFTAVSGTAYTLSVFVKSLSGNRAVKLRFTTTAWTGSINTQVDFNLTTGAGTVITGSPTFTSQAFSGGWWRFSMTTTSTANGTPGASIHLIESVGSSISYTGDGTSGLYIWGAQLEAAAFPTSYIPTTTAAATRSADVASITGTAFSSWYRQDEGTVFLQAATSEATGNPYILAINDGTNSNRLEFRRIGASNNSSFFVQTAAANVINIGIAGAWTVDSVVRYASAYSASSAGHALNGTLTAPVTPSGNLPVVTQALIGSTSATSAVNRPIRRITFWPQRLPNATLQALTQ